jgi:hypothetical protein
MGMKLGRHVVHDPRSRAYPAAMATRIHDVMWKYHGQVLDQGDIGSCTGNSAVECLMTGPYFDHLQRVFTEKDALDVYEKATHLDRVPGIYPPTDSGSSGLGVMKACKFFGYITSYHHAFGATQALKALMLGPVITGTAWTEDMFKPDADNFVHPTGEVAGGHEYTVLGYDTAKDAIRCLNHWTPEWGDGGYFWMHRLDWEQLLHDQGDVTVPSL